MSNIIAMSQRSWFTLGKETSFETTICSIVDGPYHRDAPLLFSKWCYLDDGLLNFTEKQMRDIMLYDRRDIGGYFEVCC